ncbi:MAG: DUF1697 domain-containing protein [Candidatus Levybacteria bacterium]|nr:DUF1697 domain-containing protein [Candidatus Levybacteria bacterium]
MKYVALLRGINVGGNNAVGMSALKVAFEKIGHTQVRTYINSGNVVFTSDEKDIHILTDTLESILTQTFNYKARVLIKSYEQMKQVVGDVPKDWNTENDIRCYVSFMMEPLKAEDAAKEVELREGIDFLKVGPGVLYMTTRMSGLTKSFFTKLIGKKIYQDMTMRNYTTTKKILALMNQE